MVERNLVGAESGGGSGAGSGSAGGKTGGGGGGGDTGMLLHMRDGERRTIEFCDV